MDIISLVFIVLFVVFTIIVVRIISGLPGRNRKIKGEQRHKAEEERKRLEEEARCKVQEEQHRKAEQVALGRAEKGELERLEVEQQQREEERQRKAKDEHKPSLQEQKQKTEKEELPEEEKQKRLSPHERGGRPRGSTKQVGMGKGDETKPRSLMPEIICWEEGRSWIVGIEVPEELESTSVVQDGELLERDNTDESRYRLRRAESTVKVAWTGGEKDIPLIEDGRNCLLFKMRKNWKGLGRLVRYPTTGYYLDIVPQEWKRDDEVSRSASVNPESVQLDGYKAHFFYLEQSSNTLIGFITANGERIRLEPRRSRFQLAGSEIGDASEEMGPLFGEQPPCIRTLDEKGCHDAGMIVIGEEGSGRNRWRSHFVPQAGAVEQKLPEEIVTRRGGWYFVRIYDKVDNLLESMDFRFIAGLKDIYIKRHNCLPGPKGYDNVTVQFLHQTGCKVELMNEDKQHALKISRESDKIIVTVPPKPYCDKTCWVLRDGDAAIEVTLLVKRIWWALGVTGEAPTDWTDKPIALSRKEFMATSNKALWVRLPCTRFVKNIYVGFDSAKRRPYQVEVEKKEIAIPLREFCDTEEIQNPKLECLFQLFIDSQDKTYSAQLLQIRISFRCKNCELITSSEQEALFHMAVHLDDLIPHLSYEELYQRFSGSLPHKIYQCSYCNFYVSTDDPENPTSKICSHIEENCKKVIREHGLPKITFRIVSDVEEIRRNVITNLPIIYQCRICSKEFQGDDRELRLNHLRGNHKGELFEIL